MENGTSLTASSRFVAVTRISSRVLLFASSDWAHATVGGVPTARARTVRCRIKVLELVNVADSSVIDNVLFASAKHQGHSKVVYELSAKADMDGSQACSRRSSDILRRPLLFQKLLFNSEYLGMALRLTYMKTQFLCFTPVSPQCPKKATSRSCRALITNRKYRLQSVTGGNGRL